MQHPQDQLIHKLFERQAHARPDSIAAIYGQRQLTYRQLNEKANQVAHALLDCGVQPDDRIGLFVERSLESVIGMIAILKAGGAYVPLDPGYPAQRLAFMSEDSSLVAVVTTGRLTSQLHRHDLPEVLLDEKLHRAVENPVLEGCTSRNLAYVIYTSGSTGRPKGVLVEHRNVVALTINDSYAPLGPEDCVAHGASPSFDAATWEVWATLLNGARLLIVPQAVVLDPVQFRRVIIENSVSVLWLTVGLFNEYADALEEAFGRLRYLLTGGDALVPSIVARVLRKRRRPMRVINCYGPTETTTFATTYEIEAVADDVRTVPIGKPIAATRIHILNENREPVAAGDVGEIFIGGAGVARGYLNRTALTDERFVRDPFSAAPDAKLYMTGDLGRWGPDGNIEFVGRNDLQVKIRGFRVELGEIESALHRFPGVERAVAIAREEEPGMKRLVAYVVPESSHAAQLAGLDAVAAAAGAAGRFIQDLRAYLRDALPPYMMPAIIVPLDSLPLTANGKIDRNALPSPEDLQLCAHQYVAPSSPTEEALGAIWEQALKVRVVGVWDNFFELGGDSLLAIDSIARASEVLDVDLPFMALFQYPTVRQLAEFIDQLPSPAHSLATVGDVAGPERSHAD